MADGWCAIRERRREDGGADKIKRHEGPTHLEGGDEGRPASHRPVGVLSEPVIDSVWPCPDITRHQNMFRDGRQSKL